MTAYFGFENLINLGTVTANEEIGFEKENAYDWFTYTWWRSPDSNQTTFHIFFDDARSCNYFGLASSNLFEISGSVTFEFLDINSGLWQPVSSKVTPSNNAPIFEIFPEISALEFRFVFDDYLGVSPNIGVLSFGNVLPLPVGIEAPFTPPPFYFDNKVFNSVSSKGQFLGRSVERYANKATIRQKNLNPQWMLDNWSKVVKNLETQPFFYTWNYEEYPQDAVYAWLDGNLPIARFTNSISAGFEIKCKALFESEWFT